MKIIKPGKPPSSARVIKCSNCGCVFEAEKGEYKPSSQMEVIHDGLDNYKCDCPCCGITVYFD